MGKKETRLTSKFIKDCERRLKIIKIENMVGAATPDLNGINRNGREFWAESKHILKWPARQSTCPLQGAFEKGQLGWIKARQSWGGKAYVLLFVGEGRDMVIHLCDPGLVDVKLSELPLEDFKKCLVAVGYECVVEFLESLK